jgi:hypothetical protein
MLYITCYFINNAICHENQCWWGGEYKIIMLMYNNFESSIGGVEILLLSIVMERRRNRSDMLHKEEEHDAALTEVQSMINM